MTLSDDTEKRADSPPRMNRFTLMAQKLEYLHDYAEHYDIPASLTPSQKVTAIFSQETTLGATIPVLPQHVVEQQDGDILRIIGRRSVSAAPAEFAIQKVTYPERDTSPAHRQKYDTFPYERFPSPPDEFTPEPDAPSPPPGARWSGTSQTTNSSDTSHTEQRLDLVYPPRGRPLRKSRKHGGVQRYESLGPNWLEEMLVDVERSHADVRGDLEEAKREAKDALWGINSLRILLEDETEAFKKLVESFKKVAGEEAVQSLVDGAHGDAWPKYSDSDPRLKSAEENSSNKGLSGPTPASSIPTPAGKTSTEVTTTLPAAEPKVNEAANAPSRRTPKRSLNVAAKDPDEADDEDDAEHSDASSQRKRSRVSSDATTLHLIPPIATLTPSPLPSPSMSRKHARGDDSGDDSEMEVALSITVPLSLRGRKRQRLGKSASDDSASSSDFSGSDSGSANVIIWKEYQVNDESDDSDADYSSSDLDESEDELEAEVEEDIVVAALTSTGPGEWSTPSSMRDILYKLDAHGEGYWIYENPCPTRDIHAPRTGFFSEPPVPDGASLALVPREGRSLNPVPPSTISPDSSQVLTTFVVPTTRLLRHPRALKRDTERLRKNRAGGLEAYKYDETPEYQERLRREEEDLNERASRRS